MAKTYNRLELDVNKKPNSIGIRPVQGDTKSRYLDVCLYENGMPINLTGEQVRITFRKADGSTFFNQGEVTDATTGRCQFALTNEILSEAKAVEAQISVWNAGGQILSTQVFEIYVTAAIPWADAVESENEYGVLVVLFQEIQDALDTMHKIATTFGEPGDKAAEYGVDTFWGILETLAQRGDVEGALEKKIKAYLNSTIGTSGFQSLDKMIKDTWGGMREYTSAGTYSLKIPDNVTTIKITACGAGGGGGAGGSVGSTNKYKGKDGSATVVGNLVTLAGGYGGDGGISDTMYPTVSVGNGSGRGGVGSSEESASGITSNSYGGDGITDFPFFGTGGKCTSSSGSYRGGGGGGGSLGPGGNGGTSADPAASGNKGGGGAGGYGRSRSNTVGSGGSGGSGGQVVMGTYNVTPNTTISITVGKGGAGGAGFQSSYGNTGTGGDGGDGYVKIEWGFGAL